MQLTLNLTDEMMKYINARVERGDYESAEAFVEDLVSDRISDDRRRHDFDEALLKSVKNGDLRPIGPDWREKLLKRAGLA